MKERILVDLSLLTKIFGRILPDTDTEIELIKLYKKPYLGSNSMVDKFTSIVLKRIYKDDEDRHFSDISTFYSVKDYLTKVNILLANMTIFINNTIGPDYTSVEFDSISKYEPGILLCNFNVERS